MPLSPGDKLGPYEIVAPLGAGGMGEVYRARDPRLERSVAVKVLPDHVGGRDDIRERFEREARTVAGLNHPNICSLFDIGPGYMVMELVEGETLAARLERGALPLAQALTLAGQLADALDRAHRAGVTHRDIKPPNLMVTRDGLKVLDFGLAKPAPKTGPTEATLTAVLTTEGTVMGTPQYMAPEQFEGKEADARSDIWAFGAVLYEMVTGEKAFQGKNYSSLLGAILASEPAPMGTKTVTPAWLEKLVRRCLAKDPDDRWQTMRDIVIELRTGPNEGAGPAVAKAPRWRWAAAGVALVVVMAGGGWLAKWRPEAGPSLIRLNAEMSAEWPLARVDAGSGIGGHMFAVSPDGERVVVSLRGADGKMRLYTRLLSQPQVVPLNGTENGHSPFFAPAGDWVGFFAEGKLKKIAVDGGAVVTLCDASSGNGGAWSEDGTIIAALNVTGALFKVPAGGGKPEPLTKPGTGELTHRWPQVIPGTETVLFTVAQNVGIGYDDSRIEAVSLRTGERRPVLKGGFSPRFAADPAAWRKTGHLLYVWQSTLFAMPFDADRLTGTGPPSPILEDMSSTQSAGGDFAVARNGTLVYISGKAEVRMAAISWLDSSGSVRPLVPRPGVYRSPRFSPDGKRLAYVDTTATGADIWIRDMERDTATRLTFLPGVNASPVWTPDGTQIVFRAAGGTEPGMYAVRSDGSGQPKLLRAANPPDYPYSFSPDGKRLAYQGTGNGNSLDLFTAALEADPAGGIRLGKAEVFLGTPSSENAPVFSRDGRWMAYASNESGVFEVYVRPYPGQGGQRQVSQGGGRFPVWAPNGRELLFEGLDLRIMSAGYTAKGDSFTVDRPRVWAETRLMQAGVNSNYDLAPDGKRVAGLIGEDPAAEKPQTHLTFLLHFPAELRKRAPAGN